MTIKTKIAKVSLIFIIIILIGFAIYMFSKDNVTLKAHNDSYPRGVTSISCTLTNHSLRIIEYGNLFTVEHFVDGQWIELHDGKDIRFELPLITLMVLSSVEISYPVSYYSSFDDAGDYRIVLGVSVGGNRHTLFCPFSVE